MTGLLSSSRKRDDDGDELKLKLKLEQQRGIPTPTPANLNTNKMLTAASRQSLIRLILYSCVILTLVVVNLTSVISPSNLVTSTSPSTSTSTIRSESSSSPSPAQPDETNGTTIPKFVSPRSGKNSSTISTQSRSSISYFKASDPRPIALRKPSTCGGINGNNEKEMNHELTDHLINLELGWTNGQPAEWLKVLCPDVVDHYNIFPSFKDFTLYQNQSISIQTTDYAAQAVCTAQVIQNLTRAIGGDTYLWAGSHLGAMLHGQPMPWDDDTDLAMEWSHYTAFRQVCDSYGNHTPFMSHPQRIELHCLANTNVLKVWLHYADMPKWTQAKYPYYSPAVDVFPLNMTSRLIFRELSPTGEDRSYKVAKRDFLPAQVYYFGGIMIKGPNPVLVAKRYKVQNCVLATYNHRLELSHTRPLLKVVNETKIFAPSISKCMDCHALYQIFPFANGKMIQIQNGTRHRTIPSILRSGANQTVASTTSTTTPTTSIQTKTAPKVESSSSLSSFFMKLTDPRPFGLREKSTCLVNSNLTQVLTSQELGWTNGTAPDWLQALCPEVVDHFDQFPSYRHFFDFQGMAITHQTTDYAAQSVCTAKVVQAMAASLQARLYLYAGGHLGALLHGQPMPWDDDIDLAIDRDKLGEFMEICGRYGNHTPILTEPQRVELHCLANNVAIKVWLYYPGMPKGTLKQYNWYSPSVDLFALDLNSPTDVREFTPDGTKRPQRSYRSDFFPSMPYYYGGIYLMGPQPDVAKKRYTFQNCLMGWWNHRYDQGTSRSVPRCVDCSALFENNFPFTNATHIFTAAGRSKSIYPIQVGLKYLSPIQTTLEQRHQWFNNPHTSDGQRLTDALPNLNAIEIDNTISPLNKCSGKQLKVVEFNAERGRRWLESAELLKDADIIILNEMDIGMARSDQQHTTKLLAHYLGMNYAWGLEFMELTLGYPGDLAYLGKNETNFHGLHGNAILSKCKITDGKIIRDPVGQYYDNKPNGVNGKGTERRLGGRMILLCKILVDGASVVVGSIHTLKTHYSSVKQYIENSPTIIAGDQNVNSRVQTALNLTVIATKPIKNTWPASCQGIGHGRGDNIFSNLKLIGSDSVTKPCVSKFGIDIFLSDHAILGATLELP